MSREIKFRAWDKKRSIMDFGYFTPSDFWGDGQMHESPIKDFEPEDFVWMQYTGLKDKNGKEIYEGDVIEDSIGNTVVIFKDGAFRIDIAFYPTLGDYNYSCSVLGNIYENPELLTPSETMANDLPTATRSNEKENKQV